MAIRLQFDRIPPGVEIGPHRHGVETLVYVAAGEIVLREASVERLFTAPAHPYTRGLFASQLRIDRRRGVLSPIRGMPPDPARLSHASR